MPEPLCASGHLQVSPVPPSRHSASALEPSLAPRRGRDPAPGARPPDASPRCDTGHWSRSWSQSSGKPGLGTTHRVPLLTLPFLNIVKIVNTQFLIIFLGAASVTILSRVMGSIPFNILIQDI